MIQKPTKNNAYSGSRPLFHAYFFILVENQFGKKMKSRLLLTMLSLLFATTFAENVPDTANFDILHGSAYYYSVNAPSEAPSTLRNLYTPHLMFGHNLASINLNMNTGGIASYASGSHTSYIALQGREAMFGIATKTFGLGFGLIIDEKVDLSSEKDAYHKDESTEIVSKNALSLRFSMPLQSVDFLAFLRFTQGVDSVAINEYTDSEGKNNLDYHRNNYEISGSLSLTNRPSAKNFFWSSGIGATRNNRTRETTYKSTIDPDDNYHNQTNAQDSYIYANLFYNFSSIVLKSKNARLHVGNNARLYATLYDQVEDKDSHRKDFYVTGSLILTPNILAEYAFNENWMFWGAASYTWTTSGNHEDYIEYWKDENETKNKFTRFSTNTGAVDVSTGLLFKYKKLTLEAGVASNLFSNPFRGFSGNNVLYNFTGIVEF